MKPEHLKKNIKVKDFLKRTTFSLQTVVGVCFVLTWVLLVMGTIPEQATWEIGTVATRDLQADRSVTFQDKEATKRKEMEALKGFQEVYKLNMDRFNRLSLVAIDNIFSKMETVIRGEGDAAKLDDAEKRTRLQTDASLDLDDEDWKTLLTYDSKRFELLHQQAVDLTSSVMGAGVREADLTKARENLVENVKQSNAFSVTDKKVLEQILGAVTLYPTLIYDQHATEQKKNEITRNVEPVWHTVQKGQAVVNRGEVITASQYDAMQALGYTTDRSVFLIALGLFGFVAAFFFMLYEYFRRFSKRREEWERDMKLLLVVIVIEVIGMAMVSAIQIGSTNLVIQQVVYLAPVAAGAMLVALLIGTMEAIFVIIISSMFLGIYSQDITFMIAGLLGGIAGVAQTRHLRKRYDVGWAALYVSAAVAICALFYGLIHGYEMKVILLGMLYGVGNGFLSVVLTLGLLPYFEVAFNITTSMSLLELGDPSNKLLKRLMQEAPGTYHHSLMVANLAEAAADVIGADPLVVRIGAYYHDVGKLRRPAFFSENQLEDENPHEKITPMLSTLIITSHVKDGILIAKEARLPEIIIDMIGQHHGNSVIGYFYAKAKETDAEVSEEDFRYHQKKPQTREAAIIMMADTVEAAVRSKRTRLSPGQIEGFIRQLIRSKQMDGQFEECDLTFKDLNDVAEVFTRLLCGIYHKRIEYPDTVQLTTSLQGE